MEDPFLPDLGAQHYYIDLLFDAGVNEMTWQSLKAWHELMNLDLAMWELRLIKTMSSVYAKWAREYNGTNKPAPYSQKDYLDGNIKNALRQPVNGN